MGNAAESVRVWFSGVGMDCEPCEDRPIAGESAHTWKTLLCKGHGQLAPSESLIP